MNLRKTLEMMLAIAKVQDKEKAFMEKVKTTLHLSTLLQLYTGQVYQKTTTQIIVATQTLDDDHTPSNFLDKLLQKLI